MNETKEYVNGFTTGLHIEKKTEKKIVFSSALWYNGVGDENGKGITKK